jgi:hypothetical protein
LEELFHTHRFHRWGKSTTGVVPLDSDLFQSTVNYVRIPKGLAAKVWFKKIAWRSGNAFHPPIHIRRYSRRADMEKHSTGKASPKRRNLNRKTQTRNTARLHGQRSHTNNVDSADRRGREGLRGTRLRTYG